MAGFKIHVQSEYITEIKANAQQFAICKFTALEVAAFKRNIAQIASFELAVFKAGIGQIHTSEYKLLKSAGNIFSFFETLLEVGFVKNTVEGYLFHAIKTSAHAINFQ